MNDSLPSSASPLLREPLLQQQQQQQQQEEEGHGIVNNNNNNNSMNMAFSTTPATFYSCRTSAAANGTRTEDHHENDLNDDENMPHDAHHHHHHHHHTAVPWYRNSLQIMAMLSNYSTSYNVVNISLVLPILEQLLLMQQQQDQQEEDTYTTMETIVDIEGEETTSMTNASAVASSLLAGMVLGQVVGGCLGDASCLGLKRALILVMVLQIVASLGSAIVVPSPASTSKLQTNSADDLYWSLAAWRFVLGIGAGAVYPLAACLSVEQGSSSNGHHHHHNARRTGGGGGDGDALPAREEENRAEANRTEVQNNNAVSSPPRQLQCRHPPISPLLRDDDNNDHDDNDESFESLSPPDDVLFLLQQQQQQKEQIIQQSRRVVWTFCTQGLGFWTVPVIASVLLYTVPLSHLDVVWRILLGLGSVPGFVLIYLQCRLYRHQNNHASHHAVSHHSNESSSQNGGGPHHATVSTVHNLRQRLHLDRHDGDGDDDMNNDDDDGLLQQPLLQGRGGQEEDAVNGCCPTTGPASGDQNHSSNNNNNIGNSNHHHHFHDLLHDNYPDSDDDDEETVRDCELRCDSDGEVGTLLDSNPDLSSVGIFRASEHAAIRLGWWASLTSEPDLVRKLLGTAGTWFLFDVLFYGNTLFQPIVTEAAFGPRQDQDPLPLLQRTATDSLLLTSIALPGYFVAALVMGRTCCGCSKLLVQTPRFVMLQGFAVMAVLYTTIGLQWKALQQHNPLILLFLYSSTFFFANYGPNTTTFILPSLVFSPECRSTLNGLAAASGKAGALAGASFFAPAAETWGDATVMLFCGGVAVVAFIMTQLFVQIPKHNNNNNNNHDNVIAAARMMAATAFENDGVQQQHQRVVSLSDSFNPRQDEEGEVIDPNTSHTENERL